MGRYSTDTQGTDWFDSNSPVNTAPANTMAGPTGPVTYGPAMRGPNGLTFYQGSDGKVYDSNHTVVNVPNQTPNAPFGQQPYGSPAPTSTPTTDPKLDALAKSGDWQGFFKQLEGSSSPSPTWLQDHADLLKSYGITIPTHAGGTQNSTDKITLPNGQMIDFITGSDGSNPSFSWQTIDPNAQQPAADQSGMAAGALLQPFTEQFNRPEFQAPTGVNEQNDPGFQARLNASNDALQRSAAAKGTLLTGQTLKDLDTNSQMFASNEYGNVYNRAAQDYATNYNNAFSAYNDRKATFYSNQDNPFAKLMAQETLDSSNNNAANQVNLGYAGINSNNTNQANALGFNYAQLYGNTLTNGANNYGNYLTQGANANAAGQVANGNIYGNLFGNTIPSTALGLYYNSQKPTAPVPGMYGGY